MKFKINWGVGIVIAFVAFISFILVLVVRMSTEERFSHDLVVEEYYKQELGFQDEIDAQKNANKMSQHIKLQDNAKGLEIIFPPKLETKDITGSVYMYRPANKVLDFELPLQLEENKMLIPRDKLLKGKWKFSMKWKQDGENFMYKEDLRF